MELHVFHDNHLEGLARYPTSCPTYLGPGRYGAYSFYPVNLCPANVSTGPRLGCLQSFDYNITLVRSVYIFHSQEQS